jgi:hypothetical protein
MTPSVIIPASGPDYAAILGINEVGVDGERVDAKWKQRDHSAKSSNASATEATSR